MAVDSQVIQTIKDKALLLLSYRDYTVVQLRQRLIAYQFDLLAIEQVLKNLIALDYLSDQRFVEQYLKTAMRKGWGGIKIRSFLLKSGVEPALITECLVQLEQQQYQQLQQVYQKKFGHHPINDHKDKAKRIRFLQYRGFSMEHIYTFLQHYHDNGE